MPNNNPVTRFGRGFDGFIPVPRPMPNLSGAKPNAYGPGVDYVPKGSTRYTIGNTGKPLRPGDAAVSPDLVRKHNLRNGDYFTYHGQNYRYNDQSFISKNRPNTNTVEVWYPTGQKPGANGLPQGSSPRTSVATVPKPSPTAPSKPEGSGRGYTERSATLTTNPNDDWIGVAPETTGGLVEGGASNLPSFQELPSVGENSGSYVDAIYPETATPPEQIERTQYYPETTVAQEPWQVQNFYDESGSDNWWSQPESQSQMTAADRGEGRSVFGAADTATGQSWDTLAGGSEQDSHAFEFIEGDNSPPVVAQTLPPDEAVGPAPQREPGLIGLDDTAPPDDLLAEQETPPSAEERYAGNEPVPSRNVVPGMDMNGRPMPNLLGLGISPFPATQAGSIFAGNNVSGGDIDFGGTPADLQPGEQTIERGSSATAGSNLNASSGVVGSQGQVETGYGPMGVSDYSGPRVADASTQWTKDPQLGWVPKAQAAPPPGLLTQKQYAQATFGGLTPSGYRDTTGSAIFDSRAANLGLMGWAVQGWNPNDTGTTSDEGQNRFYNGVWQLDSEGGFSRIGERNPGYRRPTQPLIAGRTVNGRPWPAPLPAGGHG